MPLINGHLNPHPDITPQGVFTLRGPRRKIPLVYILWRKGVPVYVGSTQCLRERLWEKRSPAWDSVSYLCQPTMKIATEVEQLLIRILNPIDNHRVYRPNFQFGQLQKSEVTRV